MHVNLRNILISSDYNEKMWGKSLKNCVIDWIEYYVIM